MPSLRLHIVYINSPISCCFSKKILILLCFCIKMPKHLSLFCTILTPALEFVQEIALKMQFFLRFVCKYFCIFAVSFLLFPRENILFGLFCARFVILSGVISGGISTVLHTRITDANIFAYQQIRSFRVREAFLSVSVRKHLKISAFSVIILGWLLPKKGR